MPIWSTADILDKKYVEVYPSEWGDGARAKRDIPSGTIFSNYGGNVYSNDQYQKLFDNQMRMKMEKKASGQFTDDEVEDWYESLWMYRYQNYNFF